MQRVNATYQNIRKNRQNLSYTPAQFGGLFGQEATANSGVVLEIIEFEIK